MHIQTIPKNVSRSGSFITFLRIRNSGSDSPTTAIINARPVPRGTHLTINAWMIGITLVALAYIGIQSMTAIGTAKGVSSEIYCVKNPSGTNP